MADPIPARKQGLSVLGKVFIGCGSALLCFLLAIGALVWVVFHQASRELDRGWVQIHALGTEQGARDLYRRNPGLAQNYATEEDFVKASASWRPKLAGLPEKRPGLGEFMSHKGGGIYSVESRSVNGKTSFTMRVRLGNGATLVVEIENDKFTDLQVE
jgi:hypothetical protein